MVELIKPEQLTSSTMEWYSLLSSLSWFHALRCLVGQWADPSGTAMLGQPATKPEQAPELRPLTKISLISKGAHGPRIRY